MTATRQGWLQLAEERLGNSGTLCVVGPANDEGILRGVIVALSARKGLAGLPVRLRLRGGGQPLAARRARSAGRGFVLQFGMPCAAKTP
jgi:hypothetical protein